MKPAKQLKVQELARAVEDLGAAVNQQGVMMMTLLQYLVDKGVVNLAEFQVLFQAHLKMCFDQNGALKVDSLAQLIQNSSQTLEKTTNPISL